MSYTLKAVLKMKNNKQARARKKKKILKSKSTPEQVRRRNELRSAYTTFSYITGFSAFAVLYVFDKIVDFLGNYILLNVSVLLLMFYVIIVSISAYFVAHYLIHEDMNSLYKPTGREGLNLVLVLLNPINQIRVMMITHSWKRWISMVSIFALFMVVFEMPMPTMEIRSLLINILLLIFAWILLEPGLRTRFFKKNASQVSAYIKPKLGVIA